MALAWFVVPASVMPEFLVVLGLTDDAAVVALVAGMVRRQLARRAALTPSAPQPSLVPLAKSTA